MLPVVAKYIWDSTKFIGFFQPICNVTAMAQICQNLLVFQPICDVPAMLQDRQSSLVSSKLCRRDIADSTKFFGHF